MKAGRPLITPPRQQTSSPTRWTPQCITSNDHILSRNAKDSTGYLLDQWLANQQQNHHKQTEMWNRNPQLLLNNEEQRMELQGGLKQYHISHAQLPTSNSNDLMVKCVLGSQRQAKLQNGLDTVSLFFLPTHEGRKDWSSIGHLQDQQSTIVRAHIKRTRMDGNARRAQTIHSIQRPISTVLF